LYETSSGHATLAGYDISKDTKNVYQSIGICPQFDILWPDLTISEHLYFYARLKGVLWKDEKKAVDAALKSVSLSALKDRQSKGLSGGEKRRLSIAIALLGNPKVIFLDEPTVK
jgi:ABC-type multidrug transport system ATPase subunit